MALPDSFLQELRLRNPASEVISSYVNLKKAGRNMVGLCPFHGEKTPSFTVYNSTESFYCFGCGAGGDVITFIRRIENLDYIEAVKFLAQKSGMQMPEMGYDDTLSKLRTRIFEMNRATARFYHSYLYSENGKKGLDYFRGRGLSDATIKHFGLGYAPEKPYILSNHLLKLGYSEYEIIQANLAFRSHRTNKLFDKFIDRVIYPLIDLRGNVVAFAGRTLNKTDKAKYVNTSDTPVFKKSENIFALNFAKNINEKQIIIAEGYMDVIALHQAGFQNTVACMGTAFTREQAQILSRYAEEIVLCFDSDGAGQKATARAIEVLRNTGVPIKILRIPGNKDPDEFLKVNGENGPAKFRLLLEQSGNDIEYKLQLLRQKYDIQSAEGRVHFLTDAAKIIAGITNSIEADVYAGKLSSELEISKDAMIQQINKYRRQQEKGETKALVKKIQTQDTGIDKINPEKSKSLKAAKAEEALISYLFKNPDHIKQISSKISAEDFITEFNRKVYSCICTRLLNGQEITLSDISGEFSVEENSRIAYIANKFTGDLKYALDCVQAILDEKNKHNIKSTDNPDDLDILKYIDSIKKKK